MYCEIIAVSSDIHKKHRNSICDKNEELLNFKIRVTYGIHWVSEGSGLIKDCIWHGRLTLPYFCWSWRVYEHRTNINGAIRNKNEARMSNLKPRMNSLSAKTLKNSKRFKFIHASRILQLDSTRSAQDARITKFRIEASFFSSVTIISAQTIEWITT